MAHSHALVYIFILVGKGACNLTFTPSGIHTHTHFPLAKKRSWGPSYKCYSGLTLAACLDTVPWDSSSPGRKPGFTPARFSLALSVSFFRTCAR